MSLQFEGKVALVTGASRGIGRAIARRLASAGATVVCGARGTNAQPVADEIVAAGGRATAVALDITDPATIEAAVAATLAAHVQWTESAVGRRLLDRGDAAMVAFVKVPLGNVADPTDTSYIPRPEWYFLFLFQMLKVFEGKLEVVGAIILPGIAVGSLLLMPFIDRAKAIQVRQRTTAIGVVVLAALGWAAPLTTAMPRT